METAVMNFAGLKVHIIGLGSLGTGQACARVLAGRGAQIEISDCKPEKELTDQISALSGLPITFHLGEEAYSNIEQAELIIPSPGVPLDIPPLQRARAAGIPVVSEIEAAYWIAPCPIIAVSGTKGKTTTTTLIGRLLEAAGRPVLVGGNIGTPLIQLAAEATPDHLLVAEVSSFQLEGTRDFHPHIAVFLNFFADHLDRHPDLASYWQAKTKLFANQEREDYAVLNFDDVALRHLVGQVKSQVVFFAVDHSAQVEVRDGFLRLCGRSLCPTDKVRLRGKHNLCNVLAALAAVWCAGAGLEKAEKVLADFRGVANRLEEVAVVEGVTFINDSQATIPEAAQVALEAMDAPAILIAGGRPKVKDFSALAGAVAQKAKALILIGEAAEMIASAAKQAGFSSIQQAATLPEAVQTAFSLARPGEIILLSPACASFDMFTNMAHRGEVFRQAVRALEAERKAR